MYAALTFTTLNMVVKLFNVIFYRILVIRDILARFDLRGSR